MKRRDDKTVQFRLGAFGNDLSLLSDSALREVDRIIAEEKPSRKARKKKRRHHARPMGERLGFCERMMRQD